MQHIKALKMFDLILLPDEQNRAMLHLYPVTNLLK
jgi:hypothetical protein